MRAVESLSRLGPHGVRWDGMHGSGVSIIGRDEVLDALAAVEDPLGQALLLMTAGTAARAHRELVERAAWAELDREDERLEAAAVAEQQRARRQLIAQAVEPRRRLPRYIERPCSTTWPDWIRSADRYRLLVPAVIAELTAGPITCLECRGSRTVPAPSGEGHERCPKCGGTGLHPACPRERGEALGVSRVAYLKTWAPVWEHLARYLANAMQNAVAEFDARIRANVRDAAA